MNSITRSLSADQWDSVAFWIQVALWILGFAVFALGVAAYWAKSNSAFLKQESSAQQEKIRETEAARLKAQLIEADKKVAELQAQQVPRRLTAEQRRALVNALAPFKGQTLTIRAPAGNPEGNGFARDFVSVFAEAEWDYKKGSADMLQTITTPPLVGLQVQFNEGEGRAGRILRAAEALVVTLQKLGIVPTNELFLSGDATVGEIVLNVGAKAAL